MPDTLPTPASSHGDAAHQSQPPKSKRVLACHLCQKRKVKCDRRFPCRNCTKRGEECVPITEPRPRRRRVSKQVLLDRLREVEEELRRNKININFPLLPEEGGDPRHGGTQSTVGGGSLGGSLVDTRLGASRKSRCLITFKGPKEADAESAEDDNSATDMSSELSVRDMWDRSFTNDDSIMFGSPNNSVDLASVHPGTAQIFRFWQLYLDNVNPLLKVTHAPSLQGRIIEAVGDLGAADVILQALMFGVYSVATMSISDEECQAMFGARKEDLMAKYQFGCKQALIRAKFLRSRSLDCLVALFLYLVSMRAFTHPQSLWCTLGMAVRIAQRMEIQRESENVKYPALEAEMRRRVWWSLIMFDWRMREFSQIKATMLNPSWDCRLPSDVSDSELNAEMKAPPVVHGTASEAFFVTVRSAAAEFVRHSPVYLDFSNPLLKPIAMPLPGDGSHEAMVEHIEQKYLQSCNPDKPLDYMTKWTVRAAVAKYGLMEHCAKFPDPSVAKTDRDSEIGLMHAFKILESDSRLGESPLTKRFKWYLWSHFPLPAYFYTLGELRRRPLGPHGEQAWEMISTHYESRFPDSAIPRKTYMSQSFHRMVLHGWKAYEAARTQAGLPSTVPRIIERVRMCAESEEKRAQDEDGQPGGEADAAAAESLPTESSTTATRYLDTDSLFFGAGVQGEDASMAWPGLGLPAHLQEEFSNWTAGDLGFSPYQGW